jgi:hypothetical protein
MFSRVYLHWNSALFLACGLYIVRAWHCMTLPRESQFTSHAVMATRLGVAAINLAQLSSAIVILKARRVFYIRNTWASGGDVRRFPVAGPMRTAEDLQLPQHMHPASYTRRATPLISDSLEAYLQLGHLNHELHGPYLCAGLVWRGSIQPCRWRGHNHVKFWSILICWTVDQNFSRQM